MRKRLLHTAFLALLSVSSQAADRDSTAKKAALESPACKLVQQHEIEAYIGTPAAIRESRGSENEASICSWAGGNENAAVSVMLFPGSSHGVPKGSERAYFDQMIEGEKVKYQAGEFVAVPELADDAWAVDLADNPTQYFAVYLFKGESNATVVSNGIGLEATVAIAREIAAEM